jgi:hypothetical protein
MKYKTILMCLQNKSKAFFIIYFLIRDYNKEHSFFESLICIQPRI